MQEFSATVLAPAYALVTRPDLIEATIGSRTRKFQRYTSFEDKNLIYEGVGIDNYDWLQVETDRLVVYFVKNQNLAGLIKKMQAAFPAGRSMSNNQVLSSLDVIRPGFFRRLESLQAQPPWSLLRPVFAFRAKEARCKWILRRAQ